MNYFYQQHIEKVSLFLLAMALLVACKSTHPVRLPYALPQPQQAQSTWQEILHPSPAKIDSFTVLHTGSVQVPVKGMLNRKKLPKDHSFGKLMWVDVFVFLFHHREKGWYMVDAGLDSSFQHKGNISGLLASNYIKQSRQQVGQNIAAQLKKENKAIQGIFLTHLHGDHSAGLPEIDPSIPKYVGQGEVHLHLPLLYHSNHLSAQDTLWELPVAQGISLSPFDSMVDIFGDASFFGIHTPGHSHSHLSYLLIMNAGPVLLTGDASHTRYGFLNNIEPGWVDDQAKAVLSLQQLRAFMTQFPETQIIYGHER